MVLKIHGFTKSTCTRLVALICKEKGIPYELVNVDLSKGEHKGPGYRKYQPWGQIPYIDDEGFILYESRAISRYLIKKYADQGTQGLVPTDPKEEALFEQAYLVEIFNFNSPAGALAAEKMFKLYRGLTTDQAKVEENIQKLRANLDVYEGILSNQKYLGGNNVTLADLQHLPYGDLLFAPAIGYGEEITKRPNVARWWKDISSRPAWLAVKDGA